MTAAAVDQGLCTTGAPPIPIAELTIDQAHEALWQGNLTCSDLVAAYLARIAAFDQRTQLNAVQALNSHAAEEAGRVDAALQKMRGNPENRSAMAPLLCIPMLIKDNIDMVELPTTAGEKEQPCISLQNSLDIPPSRVCSCPLEL